MSKNKNILFIHGAWSTKTTFNFLIQRVLEERFPVGEIRCFEYDSFNEDLPSITHRAQNTVEDMWARNYLQTVVVGHSLGGLIAMHISDMYAAEIVTMATPLSGIHMNFFFKHYLLHRAPILRDAVPESDYIKEIHNRKYTLPVTNLVAIRGFNPAIYEPSDGVVSVASQMKWSPSNATRVMVPANHHEILQSAQAVMALETALKRVSDYDK